MSEQRNLWIGLLVSGLLTAGLIGFLLEKVPLPVLGEREVAQAPATEPLRTEPPVGLNPSVVSIQPVVVPALVETPPPVAKVAAEAIGLPESLDLSADELAKLSAAERAKYDEMLAAYREVRARVLRLHQEREQLKQRMDKIVEQNADVEQQLEAMRQQLSTDHGATLN